MDKSVILKIVAGLGYAGMITVNALANILPINNITTGEVSDSYPNLFAPAGITFSIWGLIYLLLGAYTLYQFGFFQKDKGKSKRKLFEKINVYFILSSVANILWIFTWHYRLIGLTVILMIVILVSLIKIADIVNKEKFEQKEKFFVVVPFSVYFGWITVATIANITVFLVSIGWNGFGIAENIWMIIILLIGTGIGIARMYKDRNIVYGSVFVWAYLGILIRHTSPDGFGWQHYGVIFTVIACIFLFLAAKVSVFKKKGGLL
jgi:hypothetical protein